MKKLLFSLAIISFALLSFACKSKSQPISLEVKTQDTIVPDSVKSKSSARDTFTVVAVGDIMLGTNYPAGYLPPGNDCHPLIQPLVKYLKDADLTFGNLEGAVTDHPEWAKGCNSSKWCYRFSMPVKYLKCLTDAGFDVVNVANNHVYDLGQRGLQSTVKALSDAGLHFAGVCTHPVDTFTIDGVKIGFAAFSPHSGTCQMNDYNLVRKTVSDLKKECQIVIVSFHGGAEGSKHQHVPKQTETFLGYNRGNVYEFARVAIDAGADLVLGHGPHVTRAVDLYKGKFIAYSLGNFCTYKRFNLSGPNGVAPIVKIWLDNNGNFIKAKIIPVYQDKQLGTRYDSTGRVIKIMQQLTREDLPEAPLKITDSGWILKTSD